MFNRDISCPGGGYCCEPPHTDDFLRGGGRGSGRGIAGGRGSGRGRASDSIGIYDQLGAGSIAGSKDLESNIPIYSDRPSFGVDLEAFKTNFITGEVPYGTDSISAFAEDISQGAPKGEWDQY